MLRAVAPDPEIMDWLWSREGLDWARVNKRPVQYTANSVMGTIKMDHPCISDKHCAEGFWMNMSVEYTVVIEQDIRMYGMTGIAPPDPRGSYLF